MSVVYRRNLGRVTALDVGEYTTETASGEPAIRCCKCGAIYDLPDTHRVDVSGFVVPAVRCPTPTCGQYEYLRLEAWRD